MDLSIKNKVAFVGGGSKGLGLACALSLAKEGAKIAICARDKAQLRKAAALIKKHTGACALAISYDLSKPKEVKKAFTRAIGEFGRIDILVANSGGPVSGRFFDISQQQWRDAFDSVLFYVIELYRLAIPHMKKHKWGRIINITSLTVKEPSDDLLLSNVFRSGVVSLAKTMSRDLIKDNITINNICPGAFKTDRAVELMLAQARKKGVSVEAIEQQLVSNLPLKRFQSPKELGDLVAFLASDLACGITGTTIQIDAGISKALF